MLSFEHAKSLLQKSNLHLTGIHPGAQLLELAEIALKSGTHLTIPNKSYSIELLKQLSDIGGIHLTFIE